MEPSDTEFALVVRDDLAVWQKLNVAAFLAGGIGGSAPDVVGEPYRDASGRTYLPLVVQPIVIFAADSDGLRKTYERAVARDLPLALYTAELFGTGNDLDNRAAVRARSSDELDLVGLGLRAPRREVDRVVKGLRLHP